MFFANKSSSEDAVAAAKAMVAYHGDNRWPCLLGHGEKISPRASMYVFCNVLLRNIVRMTNRRVLDHSIHLEHHCKFGVSLHAICSRRQQILEVLVVFMRTHDAKELDKLDEYQGKAKYQTDKRQKVIVNLVLKKAVSASTKKGAAL